MDQDLRSSLQHIGLPTACAVIYARIKGEIPNPRDRDEMDRILNDVAHAVSNIVPVYAPAPPSQIPAALAPIELIEGRFTRGAHVFRTRTGKELRGLTIQRRHMLGALGFLKAAHIRFR